ncbi:glycosyltransferase family 2 protein [Methylobacterium oryzisoli]|uniref:glycosyltransferase family 2 protein n=1 Tax=Methylobacterium oryzisoli TaxID=3385502 RepID=UPI0038924DA9
MKRPTVSVIVPMYNHEQFIELALASIINQDYRPLQVIAIDDGSSDATGRLARDFLQTRMPSAVVIERENRGAAQTINEAIRLSTGDYINILNSDDEFVPGRISECVSFVQRSGREMVFGEVEFIDPQGDPAELDDYLNSLKAAQDESNVYPTLGFALMRNQLGISTGNFFFSRQLYDRVGPFRSYKYVHDWDFLLRSIFYVEPTFLRQTMYRYRLHGTNSFKDLGHVAGYETSEVMRNFLWSMVSRLPDNHRAPSPHYWPGVFQAILAGWNYQTYLPPRLRRPDGLES